MINFVKKKSMAAVVGRHGKPYTQIHTNSVSPGAPVRGCRPCTLHAEVAVNRRLKRKHQGRGLTMYVLRPDGNGTSLPCQSCAARSLVILGFVSYSHWREPSSSVRIKQIAMWL